MFFCIIPFSFCSWTGLAYPVLKLCSVWSRLLVKAVYINPPCLLASRWARFDSTFRPHFFIYYVTLITTKNRSQLLYARSKEWSCCQPSTCSHFRAPKVRIAYFTAEIYSNVNTLALNCAAMRTMAGAGQAARTRRDLATAHRYPPMARRLLEVELDGKSMPVILHIIYYWLACFVLIFTPNFVEAVYLMTVTI